MLIQQDSAVRLLEMGGTSNGTYPGACEDSHVSWNIHTRAFQTGRVISAAGYFAVRSRRMLAWNNSILLSHIVLPDRQCQTTLKQFLLMYTSIDEVELFHKLLPCFCLSRELHIPLGKYHGSTSGYFHFSYFLTFYLRVIWLLS